MSEKLPQETHDGKLKLGKWDNILCAHLDNGMRVISQRSFMDMLEMKGRGDTGHRIVRLIRHPMFKALPDIKLALDIENPVKYLTKTKFVAFGFESSILVSFCKALLRAREFGLLITDAEKRYAQAAESLIVSLANVALIALIDEATGYQRDKDRESLQAILDKYLSNEMAAWAKRFPDEFYKQIFRLRGWEWRGMKINRPGCVGRYTIDLVYDRLAPAIYENLVKRMPVNEKGQRKGKLQQMFTEDIGHPALQAHLSGIMALQRAAPNGGWGQFHRMVERAYPKLNETGPLDLPEE